ncbi:hypothetical protein D3C72_1336930 [compost metagenome]
MPPASAALNGGITTVRVLYGYGPRVREKYVSVSLAACSAGAAFDAYSGGYSTLMATGGLPGPLQLPSSGCALRLSAVQAKSCTSPCT